MGSWSFSFLFFSSFVVVPFVVDAREVRGVIPSALAVRLCELILSLRPSGDGDLFRLLGRWLVRVLALEDALVLERAFAGVIFCQYPTN